MAKAWAFGLLIAASIASNSYAQRSPETLPPVTLDCYQSFATKTPLPELASKEVYLDAGNFQQEPVTRYRLQVIKNTILKIVKDPDRPAFRTEHGKSVWEMTRDFTDKHQVVGWREQLPGGIVRLFTLDFADLLFTTLDISPSHSSTAVTELHVMKCVSSPHESAKPT